MCRSKSERAGGRRCPGCADPITRRGVVIRQRISRYARGLDKAEQAGDSAKMSRMERLFIRAMDDYTAFEQEGQRPVETYPTPPASRAGQFTVESTVDMSDEALQQEWIDSADDPLAREAIEAVFEWRDEADRRRDAEIAEAEAELQRKALEQRADDDLNPLTSLGRRKGRKLTPDQRCREEFTLYAHQRYLEAEDDCRGAMLTLEGRRKGIDPVQFFLGNGQLARRYASDELKSWFHRHGRLTYAAFRYQFLGRESDRASAERARLESLGDVAA